MALSVKQCDFEYSSAVKQCDNECSSIVKQYDMHSLVPTLTLNQCYTWFKVKFVAKKVGMRL